LTAPAVHFFEKQANLGNELGQSGFNNASHDLVGYERSPVTEPVSESDDPGGIGDPFDE